MDTEKQQPHQQAASDKQRISDKMAQTAQVENKLRSSGDRDNPNGNGHSGHGPKQTNSSNGVEYADGERILEQIRQGQLLMVNSRRRNGLILFKKYHAEFAGPGAAVGSRLDLDCQHVYPVGSLSLLEPQSHEERQKAYLIRRQWIRLTHQFTENTTPLKRAQMILNQFENYFDRETIARVPDEAFALLVGVLPHTVRLARRPPRKHNVKVKI